MLGVSRSVVRALVPFLMFFICVLAQMSCQCSANPVPAIATGVIACQSQHEALAVIAPSGAKTISASAPVCAPASAPVCAPAPASVSAPVPDSRERKPG